MGPELLYDYLALATSAMGCQLYKIWSAVVWDCTKCCMGPFSRHGMSITHACILATSAMGLQTACLHVATSAIGLQSGTFILLHGKTIAEHCIGHERHGTVPLF